MKSYVLGVLSAVCLAALIGGVQLAGQSVPDTVAGHVAAAKAAGGQMWPSLVSQLCTPAEQAPTPRGRGQAAAPSGPPPRTQWFREPRKVFDNMYLFPTNDVAAWAVKTSNGIILLDTTYDYSVKDLIDNGMRKLGLDPTQIKDVVVTHGHGDHFGGIKYLQELYSPAVYMSAKDWDLTMATPQTGNNPQPLPKKDKIATDGQKLTLGDTTITIYSTPGHTAGTISFLIPTTINGKPHTVAFWGGTALSRNTGIENLKQFSASAKKFEPIVAQNKADIMISNHERFGEHMKKLDAAKGDANTLVVGTDGVVKYLQVLEQCSLAIVSALQQAQ
jgi:metallo-beta-lactamase class B